MATVQQIKTAFGQAVVAISGLPALAHENRTSEAVRPFVLVDFVPTGRINATVDASEIRASGYIVVFVCIAQGVFTTQANTWAQAIIEAFPPGRRLGGVCVTEASDLPGYNDGIGWRQPVRIDYRSEG
jgi:hypothetical protein